MNTFRTCIGGGARLTALGAMAVATVGITTATHGQCNNPDPTPTCPSQIGIQGGFEQFWDGGAGCFDDPNTAAPCDGYTGMATPHDVGAGTALTSITFTVNTNNAGGDIAILGDTVDPNGSCGNPDETAILAVVPFALEGLATAVTHQVNFATAAAPVVAPTDVIWVIYVGRSGQAGLNTEGIYNGNIFPSHSLARNNAPASAPNIAFANLAGTGTPGSWTDLHSFALGTPYCSGIFFDPAAAAVTVGDPLANTGACCDDTPGCTVVAGYNCGIAGGVFQGGGSACPNDQCTCGPAAGSCLVGNGTPGCDTLTCCKVVCSIDPFCCDGAVGEWDDNCADTANANLAACLPDQASGNPVELATGDDSGINGFLRISPDVYGSWTSVAFGDGVTGGLGDTYNPGPGVAAGPDPAAAEAGFSVGTYMYYDATGDGINESRELLSHNTSNFQPVGPDDNTLVRQVISAMVTADNHGGDGVDDTADAQFRVITTDFALDVLFDMHIEVTSGPGDVALAELTYTITDQSGNGASFDLLRQNDWDLVWDGAADFTDDSVGTGANAGGDSHVYQVELGLPGTAITVSSPDADAYVGSKGGLNPTGVVGDPNCDDYGYGTDVVHWTAVGLQDGGGGMTDCWRNNIADVGTNVDGATDAGTNADPNCAPCDGSTFLNIPVVVPANGNTTVTYLTTYGSTTPGGGEACPWDCDDGNGIVGTADLLALLAAWGGGGPCDFDGGGIGTADLLKLLANWGACP